jgi:hypothetical protein
VNGPRTARALLKHALCALLYYTGLLALVARFGAPRGPIILCAHRVVARDDPFFPGIPRERFAAEIAHLARQTSSRPWRTAARCRAARWRSRSTTASPTTSARRGRS